ncbi:YqaA family protein [Pontivivens ytuae]|uniref:YqaA family protein n=1 Tax=Pontivivens ytuae TaxID=2789856 RepID=UPI001E45A5B9|nr:YqaA family protein [Pontivivens ytuae]
MMADIAQLGGLFLAAFGAATLLPFQSEIVLVGLLIAGDLGWLPLLIVASIGNILGSVVNWLMGRGIEHFRHRRWWPVSEAQMDRAQRWYGKYGVWTLLLSWAPLGDPVTVVAGVMRTPFWLFLLLVTIAKTGRYAVVVWLTLSV